MPENEPPVVSIKNGGGPVKMEIHIGQEQIAAFTITHYDNGGSNGSVILNDSNVPDNPDPILISNNPSSLNNDFFGWNITISPSSEEGNQHFYSTVRFFQGNIEIPGSPSYTYEGDLTGTKPLFGMVKFSVT